MNHQHAQKKMALFRDVTSGTMAKPPAYSTLSLQGLGQLRVDHDVDLFLRGHPGPDLEHSRLVALLADIGAVGAPEHSLEGVGALADGDVEHPHVPLGPAHPGSHLRVDARSVCACIGFDPVNGPWSRPLFGGMNAASCSCYLPYLVDAPSQLRAGTNDLPNIAHANSTA